MVNYWYFYLKQLSKMSVCETCVARRSAVNHESVSREYRTPFCHLISRQIRKSAVTFFSGHRRRFSFCCSQRAVDVLLESITKSPVREYTHRLKRRDLGQRCASVGNATGCFTFAWSLDAHFYAFACYMSSPINRIIFDLVFSFPCLLVRSLVVAAEGYKLCRFRLILLKATFASRISD